jgi:hypothetical protein
VHEKRFHVLPAAAAVTYVPPIDRAILTHGSGPEGVGTATGSSSSNPSASYNGTPGKVAISSRRLNPAARAPAAQTS